MSFYVKLIFSPGFVGFSEMGKGQTFNTRFRSKRVRLRISANESENSPAARVATIFMGLLARASDSRSREFASLGAQGLNES